jgi:glycosyltransferase involved in cell wall biosynthesis
LNLGLLNTNMNILVLTGSYPPDKCGVGDFTSKLYNSLLEVNENSDIYLLSSNKLIKNGNPVDLKLLRWNFLDIRRTLEIIKSINPDIIDFQFPTLSYRKSISILFLITRLKLNGFRIVITLHEYSYSSKLAQFRTNLLLRSAHRLIVVDELYKADLVHSKRANAEDILYIPVGSSIDRSQLSDEGIKLLRKKHIKSNGLLIGYFGFIIPAKGVETLIQLGHILKQQNRKFKIIIAAELKGDNKYHQELLKLIREKGLENESTITGYLPSHEIADLLRSMDVVVFPFTKGISTRNTSVLAALNQGVNVISTKSKRISNSPYKQLHLIDHYTNVEQIINIIDHHLVQNIKQEVGMSWKEIGRKTIDFLTDSAERGKYN